MWLQPGLWKPTPKTILLSKGKKWNSFHFYIFFDENSFLGDLRTNIHCWISSGYFCYLLKLNKPSRPFRPLLSFTSLLCKGKTTSSHQKMCFWVCNFTLGILATWSTLIKLGNIFSVYLNHKGHEECFLDSSIHWWTPLMKIQTMRNNLH